MTLFDLINGGFEAFGAWCSYKNCVRLHRDKRVRGLDYRTIGFYIAWGAWNLLYYPSLAQWLSFAGGVALTLFNCVWIGMAVHYTRKEKSYG